MLCHGHFALGEERSVITALSGGVEVHQSVCPVRTHSRGLEVPVSHLLLVLLEALPPQGAPVHTRQHHRASQQDHEHSLLSIPVSFLFPCWKHISVETLLFQCVLYITTQGITLGRMIEWPHLT